ncbi:VOC family protein [Agromyces badenianii]|uniref:VOC family protein n=1 Tax=Agromyces badenianii TaxID=2080742 RepID=UPI001FCBD476|nr:VOC family protein [Agromyces badenianii]
MDITLNLEVVIIPVGDVDRAKGFYEKLGFRLDADFQLSPAVRVVQVTPPGSGTSIIFGTGISAAAPGSIDSLMLVTSDIEAARTGLLTGGADVSGVFHGAEVGFPLAGGAGRAPGPDPDRASYGSFLSFADPDGNSWLVQEITERLPGRTWSTEQVDTGAVVLELLEQAAAAHGRHEADDLGGVYDEEWPAWYAAHMTRALADAGYAIIRAQNDSGEASTRDDG